MFFLDILAILSLLGLNSKVFTPETAIFLVIGYSLLVILSLKQLLINTNIYLIDTSNKTIKIRNYFTRKFTSFNLNNYDGYVDSLVQSSLGTYRVIYLVKDKRFINKISGKVFSNVDEIKDSFGNLTYLGYQKLTFRNQLQIIFNKPVLE